MIIYLKFKKAKSQDEDGEHPETLQFLVAFELRRINVAHINEFVVRVGGYIVNNSAPSTSYFFTHA